MEISKKILEQAGITPKLRLAVKNERGIPTTTGPHRVKLIEEKLIKGTDEKGNEVAIVRYFFLEEGEKRMYEVPVKDKKGGVHYLVQRFAEMEPEEEIQLTFKKAQGRSFIEVVRLNQANTSHVEVDENDEEVIRYDEEDSK